MPEIHVDLQLERTAVTLCLMFDESPIPFLLVPEDFADETLGKIFAVIQKATGEKKRASFADLCLNFETELLLNVTSMEKIYWPMTDEDCARGMRELRIRRTAMDFSVSVDEAKKMIDQFLVHTKKLSDLLPNARRETLEIFDTLHDAPAPWIPTGFPSVDRFVHMHACDLIMVGARPRHGKSSFLMNIAAHALERKERVDFLTKEMADVQLLPRIIECMTGKKFEQGKETVDTELLARLQIHMIDSVQDVESLASKTDAQLILVDYVQILTSGRNSENRVTELEFITGQLKRIAMVNRKCVVCASQLNRTLDTASRDPVLSDLRGSGSIEQDSDVVILLYNNAEEAKTDRSANANQTARSLVGDNHGVTVIIAKNRLGESGRCGLGWDGAVCRFIDNRPPPIEYTPALL